MRRVALICLMVLLLTLTACGKYEYVGKEIESLEFVAIDYFGGHRNETIIDFENGQVLNRSYMPEDDIPEYTVLTTFEIEDMEVFLNELGSTDIFDLKDEYTPDGLILDGGGWEFVIYYEDGTTKESTGDNEWPSDIFKEADLVIIEYCAEDLFGTIR